MLCRKSWAILPSNVPLTFSTDAIMKLSRHTETLYTASSLALHLGSFDGIIKFSKTWRWRSTLLFMACWIRLRLVSVAEQEYSALSTHPICSADGTTNLIGMPGGSGITYTKFHFLSYYTSILQKPSDRSILVRMKISSVTSNLMKWRMRCNMLPIYLTVSYGARRYIFLLTLAWIGYNPFPPCPGYTKKDKSNMIRSRLLFCGTTEIGDTLNIWGLRFCTSSQRKNCENPASTCYCISYLTVAAFSWSSALRYGPRATACLITPHYQLGTKLTGTT